MNAPLKDNAYIAKTANGKKNLISGSTTSNNLTIGNYIGAIKIWGELQETYNCYYMVADLHAITTKQDPKELQARSLSFYAQYLACGLDAEKNTVFLQSHVSEHAELAWILSCFTSYGDLTRMTQFKDKSAKHPKNINAGLFTYPVLMAADILLYDAHLVPVGEDQKQHLELTREVATHFNNSHGPTFVVPEPFIGKVGARVMALQDPTRKMDKSDPNPSNTIYLLDDPKLITKKMKSATTDSGSEIRFDASTPEKAGVTNLISIYSVLANITPQQVEGKFVGKMYGHLKAELAELVCEKLKPVQDRYTDLMKNQDHLRATMKSNAERARAHTSKTLARVYEKVGFYPKL